MKTFFKTFFLSITTFLIWLSLTQLQAQTTVYTAFVTGQLDTVGCTSPASSIVAGTYYQTGILSGRAVLSQNNNPSTWQIRYDNGNNRWILEDANNIVWVVNSSTSISPPQSGWVAVGGLPSGCSIQDIPDFTISSNVSDIDQICISSLCDDVSGGFVRSTTEFSYSGVVYIGPGGNKIIKTSPNLYVIATSVPANLYTQSVTSSAVQPAIPGSWTPVGACAGNNLFLFSGPCPTLSNLACSCNNDQTPDMENGTFSTVLVLRRGSGLSSGLPFVISYSAGLQNSNGSSLMDGQPMFFCNGFDCPTGVFSGDYYYQVKVTSDNSFNAEVNGFIELSNTNCSSAYPNIPFIDIDDVECLSDITTFPSEGSVYNINYEGVVDGDTPLLYEGFSQTGTGVLSIDPELITDEELPFNIFLTKESNGCYSTASFEFSAYKAPNGTLEPHIYECLTKGSLFNLSDLFGSQTTSPGFFTLNGVEFPVDSFNIRLENSGCYELMYTATHPECPSDVGMANFFVTLKPQPAIEITSSISSPVCIYNSQHQMTITRISTGSNPTLTVSPAPASMSGSISGSGVLVTFNPPAESQSVVYQICLNESTPLPQTFECSGVTAPDSTCQVQVCRSFTVYNDGYDCGQNNLFSLCPEPYRPDPCEAETRPSLELGCGGFFTISLPAVFTSQLTPEQGLLNCTDESLDVDYNISFLNLNLNSIGGGKQLKDLVPGLDIVCSVLNFCIKFKVPVINKTINLGCPLKKIADAIGCNKTIAQFIFDILGKIIGGDGGGAMVVADTDGDGGFDFIVDSGPFPLDSDSGMPMSIPNRVEGEGYITVRAIGGWPFSPNSTCGKVTPEGPNLLDIIPIGSIPIVGPPIANALRSAQCSVPLDFSSERTIQVPVGNFGPPSFINCNEGGYLFSQTLDCDIPVGWSVPVALTSCDGETLPFNGYTQNVLDMYGAFYEGPGMLTAVDIVQTGPGIYQIAGPAPGSSLPPGDYTVTYLAVSCNGNPSECSFEVKVRPGIPMLQCPENITVSTDADECIAVVTGLAPLQGIGCISTINYSLTNPISQTTIQTMSTAPGENNNPDGHKFELGVTTVEYEMRVDIDGDGAFTGLNEIQTCSFTVTVEDNQIPHVQCVDVTGQLDNAGHLTVFANVTPGELFLDGGSYDNCDLNLTMEVSRNAMDFASSVTFDCSDIGTNYVNFRATDASGNVAFCRATVVVKDYFEGYALNMDIPEICFEPFQDTFDFSNYVTITQPDGTNIPHSDYAVLGPEIVGGFGISAFVPDPGSTDDPGEITQDGVYTIGTGTGWVTISYVLAIGEQINEIDGDLLQGCYIMVHDILRIEKLDPVWQGAYMCCDQLPVWLGGATWNGPEDGDPPIPAGMLSLRDVRGDYPRDAYGRWTGQGVSFEDPDGIEYTGDEFYKFDPQGLDGTYTLTYHVGDEPCINVWSQDIRVTCQELQIDLSDITVCPANLVEERVVLVNLDDKDLMVSTSGFTALAADGAHYGGGTDNDPVMDLDDVPVLNGRVVIPAFYAPAVRNKDYEICVEVFQTTPFGCAEIRCYTITVQDLEEPQFVNCPREPIVVDAPTGLCESFVNFSHPVLVDNCMGLNAKLEQVDTTGLKSGDLFPVGTTILSYTAIDTVGNQNYCEIKIIVNDYQHMPTITCGGDIERVADAGECGAVVNNIQMPLFSDNCIDNVSVVYSATDDKGDLIGCGFENASGNFFPVGQNKIEFKVYDQPLILITEVVQDGVVSGMEITNFGPAAVDISCANFILKDADGNIVEMYTVPTNNNISTTFQRPIYPPVIPVEWNVAAIDNIMEVGETFTHIFDGDENGDGEIDVENTYERCDVRRYCFAFMDYVIDEAVVNDEVVGDVILRKNICDTDGQTDFIAATPCDPGSFGEINPGLPTMIPNGTFTSLQSFGPLSTSCSFNVTVRDLEGPVCIWHDTMAVTSTVLPENILGEQCFITGIDMAGGIVDDVNIRNLNITTNNAGALTAYLRSPEGTRILLFQRVCAIDASYCNGSSIQGLPNVDVNLDDTVDKWKAAPAIIGAGCNPMGMGGTFSPMESFKAFDGEQASGTWTLEIFTDEGETAVMNSWELEILYNIPFDQEHVELDNAPGLCTQEFTWIHPILEDNCCEGSMTVTYSFSNADTGESDIETEVITTLDNTTKTEGCSITRDFKVGVTEVEYTLTDQYDNVNTCGFMVTVNDVENPQLSCPGDILLTLAGGECRTQVCYWPIWTSDNCAVSDTTYSIEPCTYFEIGTTPVTIYVFDPMGNVDSCTFNVIIREHEPISNTLVCNDHINLSLDHNCEAVITPDMLFEGDDYRCYEDYIVTLKDTIGQVLATSPFVYLADEGKTLTYEVSDPLSGNICWGTITIEAKLIPVIQCPRDTVIYCSSDKDAVDTQGNLVLGEVQLLSCKPDAKITHEDVIVSGGICNNPVSTIQRTFTVSDNQNNFVSCTQIIEVLPFDFDQIVWPDNVTLDCSEVNKNSQLTHPDHLGYPTIDGVIVDDVKAICNLSHTYEDQILWICGNSYDIIRRWVVLNRCLPLGPNNPTIHYQWIEVLDRKAPEFYPCPDDVVISTDPWDCNGSTKLPIPETIKDGCSDMEFKAYIYGSGSIHVTGSIQTGDLEVHVSHVSKSIGTRVKYVLSDECGNESVCYFNVSVVDQISPVAITKQSIVLSLTSSGIDNDGSAKLYAYQIDNGSYDQCSDIQLEIRRTDGGDCGNVGADGRYNNNRTFNHSPNDLPNQRWSHPEDTRGNNAIDDDGGEYVKFCCEDIPTGEEFGLHEVELRIWDDGNMNAIIGDNDIIDGLRDNYNTTWATIRVENKLPLNLVCPPDVTLTCDKEILFADDWTDVSTVDLSMTGMPVAYDLCSNLMIEYRDQFSGNDVCNIGTIRRTFRVTKGSTVVTCRQEIELIGTPSVFSVVFPQNNGTTEWHECVMSLEDVRNTSDVRIKRPIFNYSACEIIGESIKIDTFLFEDGACKKWRVEYNYINWCTEETSGPWVHYYTFKDEIAPVLTCHNQMFSANPNPQNPESGCEGSVRLEASAKDSLICADESWVHWQMFMDGWNNGTVDRLGSSFVNKAWFGIWVSIPRFISGALNPAWVALQDQHPGVILDDLVYATYIRPTAASGGGVSLPSFTMDAENISHKVTWKITDGCGNVDQCESTVSVVDNKVPTPYCLSVSTALMQGNPKMVELWARDFDQGSFDNCTPQSKLYFTFDGVAPFFDRIGEEHFFKAGASNTTVNATATEYNNGGAYKWLPSTRSAGKVFMQAGTINLNVDVWDESWNSDFCTVALTIRGNANKVQGSVMTYTNQPVGNVIVTADSDEPDFPISSATDADGNYSIDIPDNANFKVGASKVTDYLNGITTLDLVLIQRHLLDIQPFVSPYHHVAGDVNGDSRITASDLTELRKLILGVSPDFNNQSWRFPVRDTPVDIESRTSFTESVENADTVDFVAVKIGDVNLSATYDVSNPHIEPRSSSLLVLGIDNERVPFGQTVRIPVYATQFESVIGFQYTMNLKGIVFEGIEAGAIQMTEDHVGVLSGGHVTMSYASAEAVTIGKDEVLFTLIMTTEEEGSTVDMLTLTSDITMAESYDGMLRVGSITMTDRTAFEREIVLMQNEPNPFKTFTKVSFEMPVEAEATITVTDLTGKVIVTRELNAERGVNTVEFTREELGLSGVLFYTLTSGEFSATKKMIVVE